MVEFQAVTSGAVTNKLSGSFKITGLEEATRNIQTPRNRGPRVQVINGGNSYFSPLLGDGRWQMKFTVSPDRGINAFFLAKSVPGEQLSVDGGRVGNYDVSIWFKAPGSSSSPINSGFRRWKPLQNDTDAWCINDWIQSTHLIDTSPSPFFGIKDNTTIINWSIETHQDRKSVSIPKGPSFANIVADLFDDKDTSNVVFIVCNPRRHSQREEYIYAHTKILSSRADYFKTMFQSDFAEGTSVVEGALVAEDAPSKKTDVEAGELPNSVDSDYDDTEDSQSAKTMIPWPGNVQNVSSPTNRRTVRITDTSYKTYRAMLYFLYTGSYSFTPPTSSRQSEDQISPETEAPTTKPYVVSPAGFKSVPCSSAKSIYRLCHRLEISELKTAALKYIENSLTPQNITTEICSTFTSRFPEVRQVEMTYLINHWNEVKNSPSFGTFIAELFEDKPDGVGDTWLQVFRKLPVT